MRIILFLIVTGIFSTLHAQSNKAKEWNASNWTLQETVYNNAIQRNDLETATVALYQLLALRPERKELKDSLCHIYYKRRMFNQANLTAEDILRDNPKNVPVVEIAAMAKEESGDFVEALNRFEYLYSMKKDLYILYKIASIQYYLQRFGECEKNIGLILADSGSKTQSVSITSGGQNPVTQSVPIAAATLNMKGVILLQMNQTEEAIKYFESALTVMPEFQMALNNLEYLKQKKKN